MKMLALALVFQLLSAGVVGDNSDKLFLYTKTGDQHTLVGNHSSLLLLGIVSAGMQGVGCFVIFEEENFEKPLEKLGWVGGLEFEEEIVVKSVKFFSKDCVNISIADDKTSLILITVGVFFVLAILVAMVALFMKRRTRRRSGMASEEENTENIGV